MKRFIKWLADISGVTKDIKKSQTEIIGQRLIDHAYWFYGGIMHNHPLENVSNFATLYGEKLKDGLYPDISPLRDELYKMSKQKLSVYEDREVCGYWSDDKSPHFIKKEDYNGQEGYEPKLRIMFEDKSKNKVDLINADRKKLINSQKYRLQVAIDSTDTNKEAIKLLNMTERTFYRQKNRYKL